MYITVKCATTRGIMADLNVTYTVHIKLYFAFIHEGKK